MTPQMSLLMSVYNGGQYLGESIESVLRQDFEDFEFLIIDDGSHDATWDILRQYASDRRLKIWRHTHNMGLTSSLNEGLNRACAPYIARQDADDVSLPGRLRRQVTYMNHHPQVVLVSGAYDMIDSHGHVLSSIHPEGHPVEVAWLLHFYNHVGGHGQVMFRRESALAVGGYSQARPVCQDYALWLDLLSRGQIRILPDKLFLNRKHPENLSNLQGDQQEAFVLEDAKRALFLLTGIEYADAEVKSLSLFFRGSFPSQVWAPRLHAILKVIYRAFLKRHKDAASLREAKYRIKRLIGARYRMWGIPQYQWRWMPVREWVANRILSPEVVS